MILFAVPQFGILEESNSLPSFPMNSLAVLVSIFLTLKQRAGKVVICKTEKERDTIHKVHVL